MTTPEQMARLADGPDVEKFFQIHSPNKFQFDAAMQNSSASMTFE